ncbi:glutathionylspermidine synthase family protein [Bacillus sp. 165]|uniref:glutathionylspermidine synthase family protein n=1 Tax=Bacillus sp. 165 TaxID=1529117 RepID=UPI001ADC8209|nr:glutathionylspermidine synthase family protein [Bacillus sp. 165]MBO9129860.1 glutathionylspermidine synthase family protein [Bacillus sp. 165]
MERDIFYRGIPEFWPDLYGEEYALYDVLLRENKQREKIREATNRVGHIFFKVAQLLRQLDDETLLEMGYLQESLSFLKMPSLLSESVIARVDFVESAGTFKVLELNADTPTFIKELFFVNKKVCDRFGSIDINEGEEAVLQEAIQQAVKLAKQQVQKDDAYIVFTAHDQNIEDKYTVLYLQQLYGADSRFVPLEKLQILENEGLYDECGRKIDVLYRQTFPIECLLLDYDEEGVPIGGMLLDLVCQNKLAIINPPSAFLLQNKAVQAVIWGLSEEQHPYFTEEEHAWITEYFLPTYLEPDPFEEKSLPYVKKPIFGREGDTIEIFNEAGQKRLEGVYKSYEDYGFVYQAYVDLPTVKTKVSGMEKELHVMYGSFLLNGKASSIGCRVGGQITNNLSYYLPLGVKVKR